MSKPNLLLMGRGSGTSCNLLDEACGHAKWFVITFNAFSQLLRVQVKKKTNKDTKKL